MSFLSICAKFFKRKSGRYGFWIKKKLSGYIHNFLSCIIEMSLTRLIVELIYVKYVKIFILTIQQKKIIHCFYQSFRKSLYTIR